MRKIIFISIMILSGSTLLAQVKCVDFKTARTVDNNTTETPAEFQLYQHKDSPGIYFYTFELYTIGVKHAFDQLYTILECNNLDKDKPAVNSNYLDDIVDGITDYKDLAFSCGLGNSEVKMKWDTSDGKWVIAIAVGKMGAMIVIAPNETQNK